MKKCVAPGCDRYFEKGLRHGLCDAHYARWRSKRDIKADVPIRSQKKLERYIPPPLVLSEQTV